MSELVVPSATAPLFDIKIKKIRVFFGICTYFNEVTFVFLTTLRTFSRLLGLAACLWPVATLRVTLGAVKAFGVAGASRRGTAVRRLRLFVEFTEPSNILILFCSFQPRSKDSQPSSSPAALPRSEDLARLVSDIVSKTVSLFHK